MKTITAFLILIVAGIVIFNLISKQGPTKEMSDWKQKINDAPGIIIDVRTPQEHDKGHLAETGLLYNFNSGEFKEKVDSLDKEKTYYLYCRTGNRSGQAAEIMKKRGFENVHNIGGFEDLANAGFETKDNLDK